MKPSRVLGILAVLLFSVAAIPLHSQSGSCIDDWPQYGQLNLPRCGVIIGSQALRWPNKLEVRQNRHIDGETEAEFRSGDATEHWMGGIQVSGYGPSSALLTQADPHFTWNGLEGPTYYAHANDATLSTTIGVGLHINVDSRDNSGALLHPNGQWDFYGPITGPTISSLQAQIDDLRARCHC